MTEDATAGAATPAGDGRVCQGCGHSLSGGADFCRRCGTRYEEPPTERLAAPPPAPPPAAPTGGAGPEGAKRPRASGPLIFLAGAIVLAAAAVAAALLLTGNDSSSTTTVLTPGNGASTAGGSSSTSAPLASGSIEAGRYVQAGSFKFAPDAEKERRRLAGAGIDVDVVPSDSAQELYPGFQVLLGGPLQSGSEESALLKSLHRNGVPSAFARPLTPAPAHARLGDGTWTGKLEESSSSRPKLDRTLPLTFVTSEGGKKGMLIFLDISCVAEVEAEPSSGPILKFRRSAGCFSGSWQVRPAGRKLMLAFLPPDSDVIVLGELHLP
jgi:SPOR domain